jgi:hypothetical protein
VTEGRFWLARGRQFHEARPAGGLIAIPAPTTTDRPQGSRPIQTARPGAIAITEPAAVAMSQLPLTIWKPTMIQPDTLSKPRPGCRRFSRVVPGAFTADAPTQHSPLVAAGPPGRIPAPRAGMTYQDCAGLELLRGVSLQEPRVIAADKTTDVASIAN